MTKQELHTLRRVLKSTQAPSAPGSAYDENFRPVKVEELVPGTPNHKLLDNEFYKAGYRRAHAEISRYLTELFLVGTPAIQKAAQRRFAGKPE